MNQMVMKRIKKKDSMTAEEAREKRTAKQYPQKKEKSHRKGKPFFENVKYQTEGVEEGKV